MRDQDKYYIPNSIDEPFRVYLLTIDELLLLILPILILGFFLHQMVLGFIIGISALLLIKKFKGEQGHFYLAHLAYWYLPNVVWFKATPPSYIREYLG
jgi:conjugal transfer pilus assembly protein TraL